MSPQGKTPVEDMDDIRTVRLFKEPGKSLGISIVGGKICFILSLPPQGASEIKISIYILKYIDERSYLGSKSDQSGLQGQLLIGQGLLFFCYSARGGGDTQI